MADALVYMAGSSWDSVKGTDKSLATALGREGQVLWVDPPISMHRLRRTHVPTRVSTLLEDVEVGVTRLQTIGPPGVTRPVLRRFSESLYHHYIRAGVRSLGMGVDGSICASPIMTFSRGIAGSRLHFITDDWVSGAGLMGFSEAHVQRILRTNASQATAIAAVTGYLAQSLGTELGRKIEVVPNGCRLPTPVFDPDPGFARAALIGQLNERLDFEVLEAVARTGIHISVAGPKTAKSPETISRLEHFLSRSNVYWHGVLDSDGLASLLAGSNVGLTPYTDTQFNRSSFPLKTLEYVAAGVPVVATDLPASQFDAAAKVRVAGNAAEFARAVTEVSALWPTDWERSEQAQEAKAHSWENRASLVRNLLSCSPSAGASAAQPRLESIE